MPGSYWWALASALIAMAVTYLLLRSRTGLALKAIRDNDLAAESNGVNLWRTKLYTYIIGGAGCALVGAIVAIHLLRVQPAAAFSINWTGYLIFITVIGGVGTIEGPIIGTLIYFVLRETTSKYGEWYFIVLGILAIVVTVWSPAGIYGFVVRKTNFFLFPLQRKVRYLTGRHRGRRGSEGRSLRQSFAHSVRLREAALRGGLFVCLTSARAGIPLWYRVVVPAERWSVPLDGIGRQGSKSASDRPTIGPGRKSRTSVSAPSSARSPYWSSSTWTARN